jgi:hypothetical protein
VRLTLWPYTDGFNDDDSVVEVTTALMVCASAADVLGK